MTTGVTKIADIVVPETFTPYVQQLTEEKSNLIQSGILVNDPFASGFLAGGGMTVNIPSFAPLDASDATGIENISTDDETSDAVPDKIGTATEVAIRLSRNNSWSSMDLTRAMAGTDPMDAIANQVATYRALRLQKAFVSTMTGVFLDNTTNDAGDYTNDVSGGAFVPGVTNFTAGAFIDARSTMGDSGQDLKGMIVHSTVMARMLKNNLIDFIPDSTNSAAADIPTFLGHRVVEDDGMPNTGGVYETWIFGNSPVLLGTGSPKVPTAVDRAEAAGDGGGQEILYNRWEWLIHPVGHAYTGATTAGGGPANTVLDDVGSWDRVYSERKQIKLARLVTRES